MQNKTFEFFRNDSRLLTLYNELMKQLEILPHLTVKVRKSYSKMVVLCNHKNFSYLSLLDDNSEFINDGFQIIFSMHSRISHERIIKITEPHTGCFSHHVLIKTGDDINEQLISWLKDAYSLS
jgi:hypothetical protein